MKKRVPMIIGLVAVLVFMLAACGGNSGNGNNGAGVGTAAAIATAGSGSEPLLAKAELEPDMVMIAVRTAAQITAASAAKVAILNFSLIFAVMRTSFIL